MVYLLANSVFDEAMKEATLTPENKAVFDQAKVEGLIDRMLDSHVLKVMNDAEWLERKQKMYGATSQLSVEIIEDQGPRPYMEDRHVSIPFANELIGLEDQHIFLFGVFDGHGGSDTAEYVATHLPLNILRAFAENPTRDIKACMSFSFFLFY